MPDKDDKLSTPETLRFPLGSYPIDPQIWRVAVAPFALIEASQPTPKSDIIHSLEDNMSVKAAPDPAGILTPDQVKEYGQNPYYRDYAERGHASADENFRKAFPLRSPSVCGHERKRFICRWRCVDCGVYL